jgi:hypothetical protein
VFEVNLAIHTPELHLNRVAGDDLPGMTGKHRQKLEWLGLQFDQLAGLAQLCGIEVELEDPKAE